MEEDAKTLANRIALLRHEDVRTRKRVEETKKKSLSIVRRRQDVERRVAQKVSRKEKSEAELVKYRERIWNRIQERQNVMVTIKKSISSNKKRDARSVKEQSHTYDALKKEQISEVVTKNRERKYMIMKQENLIKKQRKLQQEKQLKEIKRNYVERIRSEMDKIKQRENDLAALKREEMALVMRLQNTQTTQAQAFAELEALLSTQPDRQVLKSGSNTDSTCCK